MNPNTPLVIPPKDPVTFEILDPSGPALSLIHI